MAFAAVRKYLRSSPPAPGNPGGVWAHVGNTTWQVRAEMWPFISAFIVRRPFAPATLVTVVAEVALLMENTNWRSGVALSWSRAAMSAPSHMSRFLTESLGLCIAIESAFTYGWNPFLAMLDADRLSKSSPFYVATGSRPDFVAQSRVGWHGIEARGRGSSGPVKIDRPISAQEDKLRGMHDWSARVATHKSVIVPPSWSMSWSWITDVSTAIDHFDPGEPLKLGDGDEQEIWDQMGLIAAALVEVEDRRVRRVSVLGRQASVISRLIQENPENGGPSWLTVASWSDRLTFDELRDQQRSPNRVERTQALRESLGNLSRAAVGAFMATVVTDQQPDIGQLRALVEAIADDAIDSGGAESTGDRN